MRVLGIFGSLVLAALPPNTTPAPAGWSAATLHTVAPAGTLPVLAAPDVRDTHAGAVIVEWSVPEAAAAEVGGFVVSVERLDGARWVLVEECRVLEPELRQAAFPLPPKPHRFKVCPVKGFDGIKVRGNLGDRPVQKTSGRVPDQELPGRFPELGRGWSLAGGSVEEHWAMPRASSSRPPRPPRTLRLPVLYPSVPRSVTREQLAVLTRCQRVALELIADGLSIVQVARQEYRSPRTIMGTRTRACARLGIGRRKRDIVLALRGRPARLVCGHGNGRARAAVQSA